MVQFSYRIKDPEGIHPRPAGILISEAKKFQSDFTVSLGEKNCDMLKLLALVGLGARQGDVITISVNGDDEDVASDVIMKYIKDNL